MAARTEDLLVSAARAGDRAAIDQLLILYQPDVRRFARRMCKTSEDADDAVQHTLLQLSTQVSTFRQLARLTSWLFAIVKHECSRLIARALRRTPDDSEVALENALSSRPDLELALALREAFGRLDADLREVVLLRDLQQLTGPEVAAELGITLEAMKSRLHRGRERLRHELSADAGLRAD